MESFFRDQGRPGLRFPADAIWDYAIPGSLPASLSHLPGLLVKDGYLRDTGNYTKAQSLPRKGARTTEYTFGPALTGAIGLEDEQEDGPPQAPPESEAAEPADVARLPAVPAGPNYLTAPPAASGRAKLGFPLQRILHGAPGSGKSYRLEEDARQAHHVIRTVFHPESRYSDFVGGLRPESIYKVGSPQDRFVGASEDVPGEPWVRYALQPGPLLKAYHLACRHPERSIVLLIEELSRANAAHVFGDALQLLDRIEDDSSPMKGFSAYEIEPRPDVRSWLELNDVAHGRVAPGNLRFPPNLYIWATMNRSDQNARQLDSAFLRRWSKQYLSYEAAGAYDGQPVKYGGADISWGELRKAINRLLVATQGIPEDKLIGPYFLPRSRLASPSDVCEDLFGYIWNDVLKTRAAGFFSGAGTYAELQRLWDDGNGMPLGPLGGALAPEDEA